MRRAAVAVHIRSTLRCSARTATSPRCRGSSESTWKNLWDSHLTFESFRTDCRWRRRCSAEDQLHDCWYIRTGWTVDLWITSPPLHQAAPLPPTHFSLLAVHRGGQGTWAVCCYCSVCSLICGFQMYNQSFLKRADDNLWLHADDGKLDILNWVWGCALFSDNCAALM